MDVDRAIGFSIFAVVVIVLAFMISPVSATVSISAGTMTFATTLTKVTTAA